MQRRKAAPFTAIQRHPLDKQAIKGCQDDGFVTLRTGVGARTEQQQQRSMATVADRVGRGTRHQQGVKQVECVLAITALEQKLRGVMQRRMALIIQHVDPGTPRQQALDQLGETQRTRHHQRGYPARQRLVNLSATSQQTLHDLRLPHADRRR